MGIPGKSISRNRRLLYLEAMQAAAMLRHRHGIDHFSPLCVYDLCETIGVTVRFTSVNMEGYV